MLNSIKTFKQEYFEKVRQLRNLQSDIEYSIRVTDQSRQKLMAEFEQWYESMYGAQLPEGDSSSGILDVLTILMS